MRDFLSKKTKLIQPSGIRKFFDIVATAEDAISLGVGEPDFVTPYNVREAGISSLQRGLTQYTGNRGLPLLRELIARYLNERFGLQYAPEHILVTIGGSEGIDLALRACIEEGDEVLIPAPAYVSYAPLVSLSGGTPVCVKCREENGFILRADELEKAVTPRAKAVMLNYPNNPTGAVMKKEELQAIADVIIRRDLLVISDEIYAELTYGQKHVSIAGLPNMQARTVYVSGFSKAFAMTGWRLGFVCAPAEIDEAMFKIHQFAIMCAPTVSQYGAVEALKSGFLDGFARVEEMRSSYDKRRKFTLSSLREIGLECVEPRGAFYAFPSVKSTGMNADGFANALFSAQKVAVVPGNAFGKFGENNVRISYSASDTALSQAFERISAFIKKNK